MPEGPTILMMAEEAAKFVGRPVRAADGNAKIDFARLVGRKPKAIRSFGKQFLIDFGDFSVRAHLLLFGSYRIDEARDRPPRLALTFANGTLNIYGGSVKLVDGKLADDYDWRGDVLADEWDAARARKKIRARPDALACDVLMDQDTFAGVGNIIKNEVLHRIGVHPAALVRELKPRQLTALVKDARDFSFQFLAWRRKNVLRRHLRVHKRTYCGDCGTPLRKAVLGQTQRRAFWCDACQPLPADADPQRAVGTPFTSDGWWARRNAQAREQRAAAKQPAKPAARRSAAKATKATKTAKTATTTTAKATKAKATNRPKPAGKASTPRRTVKKASASRR